MGMPRQPVWGCCSGRAASTSTRVIIERGTSGTGRVPTTTIDTVKAVRYTNPSAGSNLMLPGPPGAWQFINYTAPAVLGYWMDDLACKGACLHAPDLALPAVSRPARASP